MSCCIFAAESQYSTRVDGKKAQFLNILYSIKMTTPLLHILLSFYFVTHMLSNVSTMLKARSYEFYSVKAAVCFIWSRVGNNFR